MERYDKYKPSVIEWIGEIPEHWDSKRLKYVASVQPSNVDKKTIEGELPVLLCNYMDVYKNEFIDSSINFMEATATEAEIAKFKIKKGDVLVTKDSETPDDIAKPAFVKDDFENVNVICAYHLTQIRPNRSELIGEYLFRLFRENKYKGQFEVAANGVTRFGISVSAFSDAFVPLPRPEEQTAIANYLDDKTAQIETLIANKQKLIELLKEERTTIINHAVTKGINPKAKFKHSGIEWLGDIPEHWEVKRMTFYVGYVKGYAFNTELFQPDGMPVIKASDIKNLTIRKGKDFLRPDIVEQFEKVKLKTGDIIISTVGSTPDVVNSAVGQVARVPEEFNGAYLNQNTVKFYSFNDETFANDMLFYTLISNPYRIYLDLYAHGTANQASLNIEDMLNFSVAIPDDHEQRKIIEYLKISITNINNIASKIEKEIELLQDYRTALISEVVTGKIKVA